MSKKGIGALIVVERDIGMRQIVEGGTRIDARLTPELLSTLFYPNSPLHDGAVIIRNANIVAAGCFLPLTHSQLSHDLGTRHRASVGITEETDAVVIVVSEETQSVGLAHMGRLVQNVEADRLRRHLTNYLVKGRHSTKGLLSKGVEKVKDVVANPENPDDTEAPTE